MVTEDRIFSWAYCQFFFKGKLQLLIIITLLPVSIATAWIILKRNKNGIPQLCCGAWISSKDNKEIANYCP